MPSTAPIKDLVYDALDRLARPFTDDVIDDTFFVIETNPDLRSRYDALCAAHRQTVVHTWGGWWIARAVERRGLREVKAQKSSLIGQYSKLDQPAPPRVQSRKEKVEAAGDEVYAHYKGHLKEMPKNIKTMRDEIIAMVADGMPVEEAFAEAVRLLGAGET